MATITLDRSDLTKIDQILSKIKDINSFELIEQPCSGIGSVLTMKFQLTVQGITGEFSVEIYGSDTW